MNYIHELYIREVSLVPDSIYPLDKEDIDNKELWPKNNPYVTIKDGINNE